MELIGQLHDPATLSLWKLLTVSIEIQAGWVPEPVCACLNILVKKGGGESLVNPKNRTPDSWGRSLVKLTTQIRLFGIISQYVTESFVHKQADPWE